MQSDQGNKSGLILVLSSAVLMLLQHFFMRARCCMSDISLSPTTALIFTDHGCFRLLSVIRPHNPNYSTHHRLTADRTVCEEENNKAIGRLKSLSAKTCYGYNLKSDSPSRALSSTLPRGVGFSD